MFGLEMALEALGIDPETIKAQVAGVVTTAAKMEATQDRIETKLDWIIALAKAGQAAHPETPEPEAPVADPAQTALNLETTENVG